MRSLKQYLLFSRTNRGFGLVTLALALAWVAHGAELDFRRKVWCSFLT